jgi:hypothetical protein
MMCIRTRLRSAVTARPLVGDSIYKVVKYAAGLHSQDALQHTISII